jgi:hypothetical protein
MAKFDPKSVGDVQLSLSIDAEKCGLPELAEKHFPLEACSSLCSVRTTEVPNGLEHCQKAD